jgi:hypothetical protein
MNKKKMKVIVLMLFLWVILLPNTVSFNNNFLKTSDIIDQHQEHGDHPIWLSNNIPQWQVFIPTKNNLIKVEIKIKQTNMESSPLLLEIHNPFGYKLTHKELNVSEIPDIPGWVSFDFADIHVYPGDTYFIYVIFKGVGEYAWYGSWEDKYPIGVSSRDPDWDFCFRTFSRNFPPNQPIRPSGNRNIKIGEEYEYMSLATDPEGDQISYLFDWGDGNNSDWIGLYNSGDVVTGKYAWTKNGTFEVKVKAKDEFNQESDWSDSIIVNLSKTKAIYSLLLKLLDNHPNLFPHLRRAMGMIILF